MVTTGTLDLTVKQGDTFGMVITFPFDLTGVRIHMQVRSSPSADPVLDFDSDDDDILIDEMVATWDNLLIDVAPRTYKHDIELTFPSGVVATYLEGDFRVTTQITKEIV